jgi:cardiolipin synthase
VIEYNPLAPWRKRWSIMRRDHRKILLVDSCVGFTGGMNIGEDYASIEDGGKGWRDMHAMLEGPVVLDLATLFRENWVKSGGDSFELPADIAPASTCDTLARVINNREFVQRYRFRRAYKQAIIGAERTISIMNAYFLPGIRLRRVLKKAAERGVNVRVIVPGTSDVKLVQLACEHQYRRLLRGGIQIYEWPERMMHAKTAVIDGVWSTIGSYNLDNQSMLQNLEVAVAMVDTDLGARMDDEFERDVALCHRVTLEDVKKRSIWRRIKGWLAFRLRRWL